MKLVLLHIFLIGLSPILFAEEVKLWEDGKITPEQPFKGMVLGVIPGWGGDTIILQEIGGEERYCFAFLTRFTLNYRVYSKKEFDETKPGNWATFISPSVTVDLFSWSMGMLKIGKVFKEEDVVAQYYAQLNSKNEQIDPKLKSEDKETPKPEQAKQEPWSHDLLTLKDPRPNIPGFSLTFDNGVAPKKYTPVPEPLLVIHWQPPSDPNNPQLAEAKFGNNQEAWQISGLAGYFTQTELEAILKQFYILYDREKNILAPDLIVAGNNWASGTQIEPVIEPLSKKHKFRSYHIASPFTKATLNSESAERIALLKNAQSKIQQADDNTTHELKSEDNNKAKPEAKKN